MSRGYQKVTSWRQSLMSLLIFRFWTATVLTFLKNGLKFLKEAGSSLEIIPKYGRTEAQRWPQGSGKSNNI